MKGQKDRDEDLLLFKELHNREKDRLASLLQPVSDEFEPNGGNYAVYKLNAYGNKGSRYEFFGENDKNDYDWLKTPPATPLFPSLEMEAAANAPQLVLQQEILIVQPLSRFATTEALKTSSSSKPKVTVRSITSSSQKSSESKNAKLGNPKTDHQNKQTRQRQTHQTNYQAKNIADSKANLGRGNINVISSRVVKSAQILGFSNDTPSNLRTDRATSATRVRPAVSSNGQTPLIQQKSRRQSCSPSVTRGWKESTEVTLTTQKKGKFQSIGTINIQNNGTQILLGSRMVDKLMNARKLGAEQREAKPKPLSTNNSSNEDSTTGGIGRIISKSSLDTTVKHMEIKRGQVNPRYLGFVLAGRNATQE